MKEEITAPAFRKSLRLNVLLSMLHEIECQYFSKPQNPDILLKNFASHITIIQIMHIQMAILIAMPHAHANSDAPFYAHALFHSDAQSHAHAPFHANAPFPLV
jgi:hypothetical protein